MHDGIPQWIPQAFIRSCEGVGASAQREALEECAQRLLAIWNSPERHFHNVRHLADMLSRIDTLAPETQDAHVVRLAAWGHGLVFSIADDDVYSRNGGEDEVASADVAADIYASIGIPAETIDRIGTLIRGLRKRHDVEAGRADETARFTAIDVDRLALYDAHFATLTADPQRYKAYTQAVREEYAHVPEEDWLTARRDIVSHLLDRKRIYLTPLAQEWEAPARQNLTAELGRIESALADLSGDEVVGGEDVSTEAEVDASSGSALPADTEAMEKIRAADMSEESEPSELEADESAADAAQESTDEPAAPKTADTDEREFTSSLEHLDDIFTPGTPPKLVTHDERQWEPETGA